MDALVLYEQAQVVRCEVDHPRAQPDVRDTPGLMLKRLEPDIYIPRSSNEQK